MTGADRHGAAVDKPRGQAEEYRERMGLLFLPEEIK